MSTDLHPCPKCQTPMRTIERSGIHIETCPDCRGVFLDRGELDRLLDLEAATLARRPDAPAMAAPMPTGPAAIDPRVAGWQGVPPGWDGRGRDRDDDDDDDDDRDDRHGWGRDRDDRHGWGRDRDDRSDRSRRRRGGFLGELLEGFGD